MKIEKIEGKDLETNLILDSKSSNINSDRTWLLHNMLVKYSNPIKAIVRELVSNAYDARLDYENEKYPYINVYLTNKFFIVEDFASGMDYEFLDGNFNELLNSVSSLDENKIGGYGVGSKSPLGYNNEFYIVSIKDGLKNVFIWSKEDNSTIKSTCITKNEITNKINGTKIIVPLKSLKDIGTFNSYIKKDLILYDKLNYFDFAFNFENKFSENQVIDHTSINTPIKIKNSNKYINEFYNNIIKVDDKLDINILNKKDIIDELESNEINYKFNNLSDYSEGYFKCKKYDNKYNFNTVIDYKNIMYMVDKLNNNRSSLIISLGKVIYTYDISDISDIDKYSVNKLVNNNVILQFNIGELDINFQREYILKTESNIEKINKKIKLSLFIINYLEKEFNIFNKNTLNFKNVLNLDKLLTVFKYISNNENNITYYSNLFYLIYNKYNMNLLKVYKSKENIKYTNSTLNKEKFNFKFDLLRYFLEYTLKLDFNDKNIDKNIKTELYKSLMYSIIDNYYKNKLKHKNNNILKTSFINNNTLDYYFLNISKVINTNMKTELFNIIKSSNGMNIELFYNKLIEMEYGYYRITKSRDIKDLFDNIKNNTFIVINDGNKIIENYLYYRKEDNKIYLLDSLSETYISNINKNYINYNNITLKINDKRKKSNSKIYNIKTLKTKINIFENTTYYQYSNNYSYNCILKKENIYKNKEKFINISLKKPYLKYNDIKKNNYVIMFKNKEDYDNYIDLIINYINVVYTTDKNNIVVGVLKIYNKSNKYKEFLTSNCNKIYSDDVNLITIETFIKNNGIKLFKFCLFYRNMINFSYIKDMETLKNIYFNPIYKIYNVMDILDKNMNISLNNIIDTVLRKSINITMFKYIDNYITLFKSNVELPKLVKKRWAEKHLKFKNNLYDYIRLYSLLYNYNNKTNNLYDKDINIIMEECKVLLNHYWYKPMLMIKLINMGFKIKLFKNKLI